MNKTALIIGNASYPESPLGNPINDAQDVAERLDRLGFDIILSRDATVKGMDEALIEFSECLKNSNIALFFFAGHGMQIDGKNYLAAINTNFEREIDAKYSSLPLDKVIETMEKGENKTAIIILDACRTNPYERKWRGDGPRGLAPVYAPKGMIIGYATSPGQVAYDGDGRNGAYTDALLKHISTPDLTIEDLFKRVRNTLSSSTRGRQISWEHTSLMGDFYFNYSFVTEELLTEYGEAAIADAKYQASGGQARTIIADLKSYNWYVQNPAIKRISSPNLEKFTKDDLFVLGRNIYQAACGSSSEAIIYLENLQDRLLLLDISLHFHILNGILFEIYFDCDGNWRQRPKSTMIDPVFRIEESESFAESFKFINQALLPYFKSLFYIPSSARGISVDISCILYEEDQYAINAIYFEGDNILYEIDGEGYFDPLKEKYISSETKDEIKENLVKRMVVPSYRLMLNFVNLPNGVDTILAPYRFNIKRLAT